MGTDALQLVVVVLHSAGWDARAIDGFCHGMTEVVNHVEQRLRKNHPTIEVQTKFVNSEEACNVQEWQSGCTIAVLDASGIDRDLALCAGRLQGARVPLILVGDADSQSVVDRLNWGFSSSVLYRSMAELFQSGSTFEAELFRAIPGARIREELIYRFWFPRGTSTIWVVCPQDHNPSEYADRSNPDYTYLDNLGDQDALLELMVFLSRHYPRATIQHFNSGDLPDGHTSGNLVVLGGPGSSEIGNSVCAEMMEAIKSRVSYSEDCEQMTVITDQGKPMKLRAEYHSDKPSGAVAHRRIRKDVGYFARFPNPLNGESTVILVNGIHTTGVLGAAKVFSERSEALSNFHTVLRAGESPAGFECYFKVPVLSGNVRVPLVEVGHVFRTSSNANDSATRQEQSLFAREAGNRNSVRILFIAGDRGGTQLNQIQMPKEFHAIQQALRASEHRSSISLTDPILAATRERLAQAYVHRPKVVHFAGHGDERSLSIIEDHHVLANEMNLNSEEFGNMLKAIEEEVVLCVLNACDSKELARDLKDAGVVEHAIGWSNEVSDSTAIKFSAALYRALGDGRTVRDAFDISRSACDPHEVPELFSRKGAPEVPLVESGEKDR